MNRIVTTAVLATVAAASLTGCRTNSGYAQDDYRAVCTDRFTGNYLPFDNSCSGGNWYYMPQRAYHDQVEVHHYHHFTGGSAVAPKASANRAAKVQYGNSKKVDVFKPAKQAGSSIKTNQDAKKVKTVVRSGDDRRSSSFGSTGTKTTNRSSFGSPAKSSKR